MPNCKELTIDTMKFNILACGEQKTGKTRLIGTFGGHSYIFDFDDGIKTLIGRDVSYDSFLEIDVMRPMAYQMAQKQMDAFEKQVQKQILEIKKRIPITDAASTKALQEAIKQETFIEYEGRKVGLVALDGSTELLNIIMNQKLFVTGRPGVMPQRDDYGPQMVEYVKFVNRAKALPCHTFVVCHETIVENEHTGIVKTLPAITGKQTLAPVFGGKFDIIVRTEVKRRGSETEYRLLTQNQGIHTAGHRFGEAFEPFEVPDLEGLIEKVRVYKAKVEAAQEKS